MRCHQRNPKHSSATLAIIHFDSTSVSSDDALTHGEPQSATALALLAPLMLAIAIAVKLDSEGNSGSFTGEVARAIEEHSPRLVSVVEAGEWRVREAMDQWADKFVMVYEAGMLALRLDFPDTLTDEQQQQVTDTLVGAARMVDPQAIARRGVPTQDLESWRPLADTVPTP